MKKSFFMLLFAAIFGFAANAQTQKTGTTGSTKPATSTTTSTTHTSTTAKTTSQAPKESMVKTPAAVESAFKAKYANVTPTWSMKGTEYQAKFHMNNEEMKANFDASGKWLQTETKIANTSLPSTVQSEIKKEFVDYKTESACKLQSAANAGAYTAKVAKGAERYEIVFGADGKVISKTKV